MATSESHRAETRPLASLARRGSLRSLKPFTRRGSMRRISWVPMLFRSLAEQEYVRERMRADFDRRMLAKGFVVLFWGDSGWVRFFSRNAGVRPDDFKSMKIFVTASGSSKEMEIVQGLGFKPVALAWADALIQLQTGGVDAVQAPPILALSGQYYTVIKHMTELNWVPLVGAGVITRRAWDAIPQTARDSMSAAAADAGRQIQEASRRESDESVNTMKKKWGLTVHTL